MNLKFFHWRAPTASATLLRLPVEKLQGSQEMRAYESGRTGDQPGTRTAPDAILHFLVGSHRLSLLLGSRTEASYASPVQSAFRDCRISMCSVLAVAMVRMDCRLHPSPARACDAPASFITRSVDQGFLGARTFSAEFQKQLLVTVYHRLFRKEGLDRFASVASHFP